jgi:large conductance mechanosensitive channel
MVLALFRAAPASPADKTSQFPVHGYRQPALPAFPAPARGPIVNGWIEEPRMKKMLTEFREFAVKGNVVDLAIGVIIGAAFGRIVESLVGDMIMPIFGALGGLDFSNYFLALSSDVTATNLADAKKQGAVIAWGHFLTVAINFAIVAGALFLVVKGINILRRQQAAAPEKIEPPKQEKLLEEIRDLLAKKT